MQLTKKRRLLLLSAFLVIVGTQSLCAQKAAIDFFQGSWAEALIQAEKEQKLIFVDAYTTWCGPCKLMSSKVFTDKKVSKFYNAHFINVKLDVEKGEGIDFGATYNIKAVPSLLYVKPDGKIVREYSGYQAACNFLALGKKVAMFAPHSSPKLDAAK